LSKLGGLVAQASAGPDVRLDKVAALQYSIASGTYNVPASAVASKIVDSLLS
jgi:flagellar biosynthesis anti-sigma factor FlgM